MKLLPVSVRVKSFPPTTVLLGEILASTGSGLLIEKVAAADVPPLGGGLNTVILAVPAVCRSAAVICVVSWLELTKVVVRFVPLYFMTEPLKKLLPLTVRVKPAPPTSAVLGASVVIAGSGLVTTILSEEEVPPPGVGVKTDTTNVPGACRSAAVIWIVNWLLLTNVVVRGEPLTRTTDSLTKLLPLTVTVTSDPPLLKASGETLETTGAGRLIWTLPDK